MYAQVIGVSKKTSHNKDSSTIYAVYVKNKSLHFIDDIFHNSRFGTMYYYYEPFNNHVRNIEVINLLYRSPFIKTCGFNNFSKNDPLMTLPPSPKK